jgi:hypothetical protein
MPQFYSRAGEGAERVPVDENDGEGAEFASDDK